MITIILRWLMNYKTKSVCAGLFLLPCIWVGSTRTVAQSVATNATQAKESALQRPRLDKEFESRRLRVFVFRLRPGQDLRQAIEGFVKRRNIRAGFMITAVGSLRQANIRLADQTEVTSFAGKFEIVSLVGTLGQDGVHLHLSIADSTGKTVGGHLVAGCLVYTTAEIVIGDAQGLSFSREPDEQTGYQELRIRRRRR
jgi:predicted DNA-binding protein with PD1-like motif